MRKLLSATILILSSLHAWAQWAYILTTSGDRLQSLDRSSDHGYEATTHDAIILCPSRTNQEIHGFGYAITYAACHNLMLMPEASRHELLAATFSPEKGYGVSYVRISIGCNDFSSDDYSLCDRHDNPADPLEGFALHSDETDYIIPLLKEIKAINPSLKIIAAPWSAPRWMKLSQWDNSPHPYWTGGRLNPAMRETYGEYFVKFIRAMEENGVEIQAVSPQNEPLNTGNSASMWMSWEDEADFVKYGLAPALSRAGLSTRIYLFDHNYNYDGKHDQRHFPLLAYERMGTGFEGENLVAGACYHNYGGSVDDIKDDVVYGHTDKELLFTEASIGQWNDGRNLQSRLAYDMDEIVISTALNRFSGALVWNFMLDRDGAPFRPGGCDTCYGAIDLDASDPDSYTLNSHYFIMAHASDAVKPGARRIDTEGWWTDGLSYAAFLNPDGTTAILLANQRDKAIEAKATSGEYTYRFTVPARGVVSAVMGLAADPAQNASSGTVLPDAASSEETLYDINGRLATNGAGEGVYITSAGRKILRIK